MKINLRNSTEKKFNSLIKEIAGGSETALESFYSDYGRLIYSVAFSVTKTHYLAEETVGDILIKIWKLSPKLTNVKKPIGWLYTVTSNSAKDKLKAEKQCSEIFDIPQDDKNIEAVVVKDSFFSYIAPLNEEEQQIMILYFIQHLTFKLIAKEINKPLSTVSSIYYRAKKKLKQTIEIY